jgi:hypothetical protein
MLNIAFSDLGGPGQGSGSLSDSVQNKLPHFRDEINGKISGWLTTAIKAKAYQD